MKKLEDIVIFEPFEIYLKDAIEILMKEEITIYDALFSSSEEVRKSFDER